MYLHLLETGFSSLFSDVTSPDYLVYNESIWILHKEYVSLLIGLYKNNGSVSYVAIIFLFGVSQGCTFTLIPNSMGSYHGQILIEKETYS